MKLTYYGHSCVLVEHEGKRLIIDPFLSGNPQSGVDPSSLQVDAVVLTHGHGDHFGDTIEIAKANNCPVIAVFELAAYCASKGAESYGMNTGGSYTFLGFTIKMTQAFHSSSVQDGDQIIYVGQPVGLLITAGGKTFYHAGDTCLFSDLKLIGELHSIDVAALPIGDNFTMGPEEAAMAAQWVKAKRILPLHYNTFPPIRQDVGQFAERLQKLGIRCEALQSKESLEV
ncbi:metal-dependent hydrolase [Paenibacillus aurantius]|uniref:UPF0173 metal-dependent hydrolase MJA45_12990 n=1 Tax=Paenibacillus aurantius TaxID=2918900 RepID=A0AA96RHY4_9BACL|nr:metal-dependent hydrolase [Paenibacillus aurantius]WNQ13888.1 metal-dependent hydrolase [Paenibacillus aurantius]